MVHVINMALPPAERVREFCLDDALIHADASARSDRTMLVGPRAIVDEIAALAEATPAETMRTTMFIGGPRSGKTQNAEHVVRTLSTHADAPALYWFDCAFFSSEWAQMVAPDCGVGGEAENRVALERRLRELVEHLGTLDRRAVLVVDAAQHYICDTGAATIALRTLLETPALPANIFAILCTNAPPRVEIANSSLWGRHMLLFVRE